MTVHFTIPGDPQTQGNLRRSPAGGLYESNKKLGGWRARASLAGSEAMKGHRLIDGPVRLTLRFVLTRPAGHYTSKRELSAEGKRHPYPDRQPDLDKLERAVGDALTGVVWKDDARIVQKESVKVYGDRPHIEILVEDASPARPNADPAGRLDRLNAAVGETSSEVDPADHIGGIIHKLDGYGSCQCGRIIDPLQRFCPGCGRPTMSQYAEAPE